MNKQRKHFVNRPSTMAVDQFFKENIPAVNNAIREDLRYPADVTLTVRECKIAPASTSRLAAYIVADLLGPSVDEGASAVIAIASISYKTDRPDKNLVFSITSEGADATEAGLYRCPPTLIESAQDSTNPEAMAWRRLCLANHISALPVSNASLFNAVMLKNGNIVMIGDPRGSDAFDMNGSLIAIERSALAGSVAIKLPESTVEEIRKFQPEGNVRLVKISRMQGSDQESLVAIDLEAFHKQESKLKKIIQLTNARTSGFEEMSIAEIFAASRARHAQIAEMARKTFPAIFPIASTVPALQNSLRRKLAPAADKSNDFTLSVAI